MPLQHFTLTLYCSQRPGTDAKTADAFRRILPHALSEMARPSVDLVMLRAEAFDPPHLGFTMTVGIEPPETDATLHEHARRLGVKKPEEAAAAAAWAAWVRSTAAADALDEAWRIWCRIQGIPTEPGARAPIWIHHSGLRPLT